MDKVAVLTGDVVHSRNIDKKYREGIAASLKGIYTQSTEKFYGKLPETGLEFFKGDSFRTMIAGPCFALRISIILRAKLRSMTVGVSNMPDIWDARIAIRLGSADCLPGQACESDETAFNLSESALDKMKDERLRLESNHEGMDNEFLVQLSLADAIIKRWTVPQSEAACLYLLQQDKTQLELSAIMKINQSSLSRRIHAGNLDSINLLCRRFETLVTQIP